MFRSMTNDEFSQMGIVLSLARLKYSRAVAELAKRFYASKIMLCNAL